METLPDSERSANGAAAGLIAQPGHNCWRREHTSRASLLIDAENYFDALAESLERAQRSVLISCWDFDTRLRLRHDGPGGNFPTLARLLSDAVSRKPDLRIYILLWNFPVFFALDRELLPLLNFRLRSRGRIKLHFDSLHPVSASHHQKMVVVDDRVAYVGGIDLTSRRWDTSEHLPRDPRRTESAAAPYRSYHDVQMVVEGDAAAALGELFRDRWLRSVGSAVIPPAPSPAGDLWPGKLVPDLADLPVAIARTDPMAAGGPIREIEELYFDVISSARRYLYFENQFFTAAQIGDALAARLREPDGPEVVIVSAVRNPNWFEHQIMEALRHELIQRLRQSDRYGRLRVYYPHVGAIDGLPVFVHSKVMIADDRCFRVGSANLSNRSMAIDTECDLFVEAAGNEKIGAAVAGFLDRLLAEHLGAEPAEFRRRFEESGSLIKAIEGLRGRNHTLAPVGEDQPEWLDAVVSESLFLDPDEPVSLEGLVENLIPEEMKGPHRWRGILAFLVTSLAVAALASGWDRASILSDLHVAAIYSLVLEVRYSSWALAAVVGFFVAGGLLLVPESALILVTALVFGVFPGAIYALAGTTANALVVYSVGRLLGRRVVLKLARRRVGRISRRLAFKGRAGILILRLFPAATFGLTNLVAGAARYRLRDFLLGTVVGMAPEVVAVSLFGAALALPAREPSLVNLAIAAGCAILILTLIAFLRGYPRNLRLRLAERRRQRRPGWRKRVGNLRRRVARRVGSPPPPPAS